MKSGCLLTWRSTSRWNGRKHPHHRPVSDRASLPIGCRPTAAVDGCDRCGASHREPEAHPQGNAWHRSQGDNPGFLVRETSHSERQIHSCSALHLELYECLPLRSFSDCPQGAARNGGGNRRLLIQASSTSRDEHQRQACMPPAAVRPSMNTAPESRVPTRRPAALAM